MAISNDLFLAILAMDSYNRGYSPGLVVTGSTIGNASLSSNSSILVDANNQPLDQAASFFAQAYTINDSSIAGLSAGQTIISYRGTDAATHRNSDRVNGWVTGGGAYGVAQARPVA